MGRYLSCGLAIEIAIDCKNRDKKEEILEN